MVAPLAPQTRGGGGGTLLKHDGDQYEGGMKGGRFEGRGKYSWARQRGGGWYEGPFFVISYN